MARKCIAIQGHCAINYNQGQRQLEIAATLVFVCTGHKLLTDDHSDFVAV